MATAAYKSKFYVTSPPSVSLTNEALTDSGDHKLYTITDQAKRYLDRDVAVTVETSDDGGTTWTPVTTGFKIYRVNARVVFETAQDPDLQVRFASGKYYPYAQVGGASSAEFAGKTDTEDVTEFNTDGAHSYIPTLQSGTLKCSTWWANKARVQALQNRDLLIVSFEDGDGERSEGYCYTTDSSLKADIKSAVSEELTFQLTNDFFVGS